MRIKKVSISSFRNITSACLSFKNPIIYFVGQNGQGKTNFLESLCVLLTGRSFRYCRIEHLKQEKANYTLLKAVVSLSKVDHCLEFQINGASKRPIFRLDGKKTSYLKLFQMFSVIVFSPESLSAVKNGSDVRRKILDDLIVFLDPQNSDILLKFTKVLKMRNRTLKNIKENKVSYREGMEILECLNPLFLKNAVHFTQIRLKMVKDIQPLWEKTLNDILKTKKVKVDVEYVISGQILEQVDEDQILNITKRRLMELKDTEVQIGVSLAGPHKHDINFIYEGQNARYYCSQGQQRALILAFKISQMLYYKSFRGQWPILILDDVFSELDRDKGLYILEFLKKYDLQAFITNTQFLEGFKDLKTQVYSVENGVFIKYG